VNKLNGFASDDDEHVTLSNETATFIPQPCAEESTSPTKTTTISEAAPLPTKTTTISEAAKPNTLSKTKDTTKDNILGMNKETTTLTPTSTLAPALPNTTTPLSQTAADEMINNKEQRSEHNNIGTNIASKYDTTAVASITQMEQTNEKEWSWADLTEEEKEEHKQNLLSVCTNDEERYVASLSEPDMQKEAAAKLKSKEYDAGVKIMQIWLELHGRLGKLLAENR
jgi:hypothetical protein